jgi:cysteine desulfurase family protein
MFAMSSAPTRRYFDNAATSFPKPPAVVEAMVHAMEAIGAPGRGVYAEAREMGRLVRVGRERIARLVNLSSPLSPEHVVFTHNTSDALNLAIKGVLLQARRDRGARAKLHIVSTDMEHNSVLRPLHALKSDDPLIEWTSAPVDPATGLVDPDDIKRAIRPGETVLVCVNHASNVTGTVQDMHAIGRVCAAFGAGACRDARAGSRDGVLLMVDGAQSLGHVGVDMRAMHIDLLAFPGHKGLLGPQGTGGLCIRPGVEHRLATVREGGTGSVSESAVHPSMMPEKYEAGSHNAVGIAGLSEGVAWLLEKTIAGVRAHEEELMRVMLGAIDEERMPGLTLLGPREIAQRVGTFSFVHETLSAQEMAVILETSYGVLTRAGLHCAPLVHKTLGTSPECASADGRPGSGAVRLSFGPFLSVSDVEYATRALAEICQGERVTR